MRVCFISHSAEKGGAETVLLETIEVLKERGVECCVVLPAHGDLCSELGRRGVPFFIIPYSLWMVQGRKSWWTCVKAGIRIMVMVFPTVAKIRRWKCDVVYSNTVTVCIGALVAAILRRPHVWHLHEFGYEDHGLVFLFGEKLSLKIVDSLSCACIVASKALAMKYGQHISRSKLNVIYCSMHHAQDKGPTPGGPGTCIPVRSEIFRCVIVGSLVEGKRQEDAVQALAELARAGEKTELVIVGKGDPRYHERLQEIVRKNKLGKQVILIGHVEDPLPFMQSADVVLTCSRSEAFGRVTVEGMLAGKPVIGARSGATPELIREGLNGLLYRPADPRDLAAKIKYLRENPALAQRLGENGGKWAQKVFTKERYGRELLTLLTSLVSSAGRLSFTLNPSVPTSLRHQ